MGKALLNSTNTAFDFWSGKSTLLPIIGNVFHYSMYPLPGLLLVGNDLGEALIGSLITSAAIQTFALVAVGWNYTEVKDKITADQNEPVAILPSAVDAKKYLSGNGSWWNVVRPALMRLPLMLTGPLAIGNGLGASVFAAAVGTSLMEWSVLDYVQQQLASR